MLNQNWEMKIKLFQCFYKNSYNEQQRFLAECMELKEPKRRIVDEDKSRRHCTVKYSLPVDKKFTVRQQVCQKQIVTVLDVTRRRLQLLTNKLKQGHIVDDNRGKHDNRPRNIPDADLELVVNHISSFPCQENHYSRNSNKKRCLSPDLSITKMYKLFLTKYPDTNVKLHFYRSTFHERFNLRFGVPRSDTCKVCDKYYIQMAATVNDEELKQLQLQSTLHHNKADKAYKTLAEDTKAAKDNHNIVVLCVDLQQVIFTPNLSHSDVYYLRQYSNYNFCIHDMGKNSATMCLWHESVGKRGSAEISSSIFRFIEKNFEILSPNQERKLIIWSDRCVGQNNNWRMVALCHYLVSLRYFTEVNQKFLVTGHSFLPCDRDFALIEKCKKSAILYDFQDVVKMIESTKISNLFNILLMEGQFFDMSPIERQMYKHPDVKISEARWIQFTCEEPTAIRIRTCHNTLQNWMVYNFIKKPRGKVSQNALSRHYKVINPTDLPQLYPRKLPVNAAKITDLLKLVEYLPQEKRIFYQSLECAGQEDLR